MFSRTVEVRIYGALQKRFGAMSPFEPLRRRIAVGPALTILEVLAALGLEPEEVSHLFLNAEYSSATRRVAPDDQLAIFGRDMALLYRQYFPKVTGPA